MQFVWLCLNKLDFINYFVKFIFKSQTRCTQTVHHIPHARLHVLHTYNIYQWKITEQCHTMENN